MSQPSSQTVTAVKPPRASSIRSVASNSSIGSGTSLTRRSRIRTRTKTLTGTPPRPDNLIDTRSELPYLDDFVVQSPVAEVNFPSRDVPPGHDVGLPARPPRSAERMAVTRSEVVDEKGSDDVRAESVGCPVDSSVVAPERTLESATNSEADELPDINPVRFNIRGGGCRPSVDTSAPKFRDSVLTQQSFTSSSLYPPSTSTGSGPPSPRSMAEQLDNNDISSFDPDVDQVEEFDGDDVSYRLRLLVKNNYFLPPAHSKPLPSDFASATLTQKKSTRVNAPTFLDLFRVGKSKSKPPSPDGSREPLAPILRTTSDSTTASGYVPRPQARSVPHTPLLPTHPSPRPQGRVVVVREKVADLISAAKQAEQEMKARGGRRDHGSQIGQQHDVFDDVIDPTDAVDLPPPSANYPFTVQASALHGLGVQDSVGAALLAETLPPLSPGASTHDPVEAAWRKALLHEAVNHSLQNSPRSTPISSPRPSQTQSHSVNGKHFLGQRILDQPLLEEADHSPQIQPSHRKSDLSQSSSARVLPMRSLVTPESHGSASRTSSYLPSRAETPAALPTPLAPPPRRQLINPLYSLSQTDLPNSSRRPSSSSSGPSGYSKVIRRTVSSPRLSSAYESDVRDGMTMTPPPLPRLTTTLSRTSQSRIGSSFDTNPALASITATSDSHYSDDLVVEMPPRPSMTLSLPTDGRPSLSEYSQPSPTASAFQDALNMPYHSSASDSYQAATSGTDNSSPAPRYSTMSPPPRVSSSLANVALSPPPRTSSLQNILHTRISMSSTSGQSPASSDPGHVSSTVSVREILAPEPTTPPFPIVERRGVTTSTSLSLHIPSGPIPIAIHSAPPPSSPTSFFDHIQMHPNAMDDLDSSSEEEDDAEDDAEGDTTAVFVSPHTQTTSHAPISPSIMSKTSKPSLMRLGNHSTPHVARLYERRPSLPYGPTPTPSPGLADRMKPVSNVPTRVPFFNDRKSGKSDHGHTPPISAFDFYQYTQQYPATSQRRPQTAGDPSVRAWQSNQRAQASLRRLDGMVMQHMEAEKNTIKRIATSAFQAKT